MNFRIKIGIIGNAEFREQLAEALKDADPILEFHVRWYKHQDEARDLALDLEKSVDAILFSGPVPYYVALESTQLSVPVSYVAYDEVSLLKAFFELTKRGISLSTISVDTIPAATIADVCQEIEINPHGILSMPLIDGRIHDDFASFHIEHYRAGHTTCALTCRSIVKDRLDEAGIPCHFMFWTKRTILNALDLLVAQYIQSRYRGSQIAVGLLRVKMPELDGPIANVRRASLEVQTYLLECADALGVNLLDIGTGLHLFYTTYGALRKQTQDFTVTPVLSVPPSPKHALYVGIGTGPSASVAEDGARKALHHAERQDAGGIYVVLDGNQVIGPLGSGGSRLIRVEDSKIHNLAERTGITTANLTRLFEATRAGTPNVYSIAELARVLNTTVRTARRVIAKLAEKRLAVPIGESNPIGHGRPATLYRIDLSALDGGAP